LPVGLARDEFLDAGHRKRRLDAVDGPLGESDITRLPSLHDLRERSHGFLERRAIVVAMALIQIHVGDL